MLKSNISKQLPRCRIVLIIGHDDGKENLTLCNVNKQFPGLQSECPENDNIRAQQFELEGLHVNPKGSGRLDQNFLKQILKVNKTL